MSVAHHCHVDVRVAANLLKINLKRTYEYFSTTIEDFVHRLLSFFYIQMFTILLKSFIGGCRLSAKQTLVNDIVKWHYWRFR